jgi:hypothetical protein
VLLPSAAGLTTDPPAGTYHVNRGSNFTFTLTPDVPSADGTPPQVQTNRRVPDLPTASGIRITPNADGSYTVVIIGIRHRTSRSTSPSRTVSPALRTMHPSPPA